MSSEVTMSRESRMDPDNATELDELSALLDSVDGQEPTSECAPELLHKSTAKTSKMHLFEFNIFDKKEETPDTAMKKLPSLCETFSKSKINKSGKSEIHQGDTDSSDDEDNKYVSTQKYNECGRNIKHLISKPSTNTDVDQNKISKSSLWKTNKSIFSPSETSTSGPKAAGDVYTDPYFGIRIITPLISSQNLKEKMQGKTAVSFSRLENYIANTDNTSDWVLAGVIVSKSVKTSQKGKNYASWSLTDLKEDNKTVNVLLFGKAYQTLWKTTTHVVVAILNPSQLDNRKSSNDIAALSVSNPDQVMIWGQSKDMGTCKARKKNGEPCTMIVNLSQCNFCVYHVKQEYRKFTSRSELQAPSGGSLAQLRSKVLGKNEVFYGGKSYTATLAKPATKQVAKDQKRLSQLFNKCENPFSPERQSTLKTKSAPSARVQLMKDAERLQKLTGTPATLASLGHGDKSGSGTLPCKQTVTAQGRPAKTPTEEFNRINSVNVSEAKLCADKSKVLKRLNKTTHIQKKESSTSIHQTSNTETSKNNVKCKQQSTKLRFDGLTKMKSKIRHKSSQTSSCGKPTKTIQDSDDFVDIMLGFGNRKLSDGCHIKKNISAVDDSSKKPVVPTITPKSKQNDFDLLDLGDQWALEREKKTLKESSINYVSKISTEAAPLKENGQHKEVGLSQTGNFKFKERASAAKLKAFNYVRRKGPILKENPKVLNEKKRKRAETETNDNDDGGKSTLSKRYLELLNATSKHTSLIEQADDQEVENYFEKMEKKETLENKMLNTFKIDCKAVRCLKCNYKWFSASEKCKTENHPIKIISAVKRFFQCQGCKNRTVTLEIIPLNSCRNCGGSNWIRAPMMKEKQLNNACLSIRGGEQTFTNSTVTNANLDLLVPDDA